MSPPQPLSAQSSVVASQLEAALKCHERGEFERAAHLYGRVIAQQPKNVQALQCAGVLALQMQQFELAATHLSQVVRLGIAFAGTFLLLGRALKGAGRIAEAIESYERAIGLEPGLVDAYVSLGIALKQQDRLAEAARAHATALALRPECFEAHLNLANVRVAQGQLAEALSSYEQARALRPNSADLHHNIGKTLVAMNRVEEAIPELQNALHLDSRFADAYLALGDALALSKRHSAAADCFAVLSRLLASNMERRSDGALRESMVKQCEAGLLGALIWSARYEEALAILGPALEREPDSVFLLEHALVIAPYRLQTRAEVADLYRRYQRVIPLRDTAPLARIDSAELKPKLRIGYLSGDLRDHSVAFFVEPILANHDRGAVEVYCYSCNRQEDHVTVRLKQYADVWVDAVDLEPTEFAQRIASDAIDVLIDLAGRTTSNRLGVFAYRPAPLQIGYLGYPTYTGMRQIAYRLTDAVIDPEGLDAEGIEGEAPLRLPQTMFCYRPPAEAPDTINYERDPTQPVRFGSFNQVQKLSSEVLSAWAEILHRVPHSQLLLKAFGFGDERLKERTLAAFVAQGIDLSRITIQSGELQRADHLALYQQIDIALDSYPYNGATTTCEALWMGVPVVTWAGETHASRMGASLLSATELQELIAWSRAEYVEKTVALAGDTARLTELHTTLRARCAASPLRDEVAFTRAFEARLVSLRSS